MKTLLALDSSGQSAGACLMQNGALLAEKTFDKGLTHSETLLPLVEEILSQSGLSIQGIDMLAVTAGPGSFTGLRIGMATAKGLAFPQNIPLFAVSTLEAAARAATPHPCVLASLNARRGDVYWAVFDTQNGCRRLSQDSVSPAAEACEFTARQSNEILLVGDGADLCYTNHYAPKMNFFQGTLSLAHGAALAALEQQKTGEMPDASQARPVYLRLSQAERQRKEKEDSKNGQ